MGEAAVSLDFSKALPIEQSGVALDFSKAQAIDPSQPPNALATVARPKAPEFVNPLPTEKIPIIGKIAQPFGEVAAGLRYDPNFRKDTAKYGAISAGVGASALAAPAMAEAIPSLPSTLWRGGVNTAKTAVKAIPYFAASEGINLARQHLPLGKYIPPGAELLPFLLSSGKEPAPAEPEPVFSKTRLGPEIPLEIQQSRGLGGHMAPESPAAGLGKIPVRSAPEVAPAPAVEALPARLGESGRTMGKLPGESALRQVLTGQDNANLLKIAKSRGINVTKESQLKPGIADNQLVNKIIDDFSQDELSEIGAQFQERQLHGPHQFGDVGPEAWKTMSLKTFFPDLKIPAATLKRTEAAIGRPRVPAPEEDLTPALRKSVEAVKKRPNATNQ